MVCDPPPPDDGVDVELGELGELGDEVPPGGGDPPAGGCVVGDATMTDLLPVPATV